jgi:2-polyprenyl-6-methoxyphenol hydroxylase-like FAD-dependent oxidoreductase
MRILISGAGITGHTVAYWLRSYGFTPTVVKRAPSYQAAFARYESETRPFVMLNQPLSIKSANLMRSKEKRNAFAWLLEQMMQIAPGPMVEFFINRSTRRIHRAANAITLKDYRV